MNSSEAIYNFPVATVSEISDNDVITFKMYDHDFWDSDDLMGERSFLVKNATGRQTIEMNRYNRNYVNLLEFELDFEYHAD